MSDENQRKEYPLFPMLPEAGKVEAQAILDQFKGRMVKTCEEALGRLYVEVIPHIESDSWTNFRNNMMDGFKGYQNRLVQGEYDFKAIREKIYSEYRAEIINCLLYTSPSPRDSTSSRMPSSA